MAIDSDMHSKRKDSQSDIGRSEPSTNFTFLEKQTSDTNNDIEKQQSESSDLNVNENIL